LSDVLIIVTNAPSAFRLDSTTSALRNNAIPLCFALMEILLLGVVLIRFIGVYRVFMCLLCKEGGKMLAKPRWIKSFGVLLPSTILTLRLLC